VIILKHVSLVTAQSGHWLLVHNAAEKSFIIWLIFRSRVLWSKLLLCDVSVFVNKIHTHTHTHTQTPGNWPSLTVNVHLLFACSWSISPISGLHICLPCVDSKYGKKPANAIAVSSKQLHYSVIYGLSMALAAWLNVVSIIHAKRNVTNSHITIVTN